MTFGKSRDADAEAQFQRALKADPNFAPAYSNLAFILAARGEIRGHIANDFVVVRRGAGQLVAIAGNAIHSINVAVLTMALAEFLGLGSRDVHEFGMAALLPDAALVLVARVLLTAIRFELTSSKCSPPAEMRWTRPSR